MIEKFLPYVAAFFNEGSPVQRTIEEGSLYIFTLHNWVPDENSDIPDPSVIEGDVRGSEFEPADSIYSGFFQFVYVGATGTNLTTTELDWLPLVDNTVQDAGGGVQFWSETYDSLNALTTWTPINESSVIISVPDGQAFALVEPSDPVLGPGAVDLQMLRESTTAHAMGPFSALIGGGHNTAEGHFSVVVGGGSNTAGSPFTVVVGGTTNSITTDGGTYSVIVGGSENQINSSHGVVLAGSGNVLSGTNSLVGGYQNEVHAADSAVISGANNVIESGGGRAFIGAGQDNLINTVYSFIGAGRSNSITKVVAAIVAGEDNTGNGYASFIGAGVENTVSEYATVVVGGKLNTASQYADFIGGGERNSAAGTYSVIVGGNSNTVAGYSGFIGGGTGNEVSNSYGCVPGGLRNINAAAFAVISGGLSNTINDDGNFSAIGGGEGNVIAIGNSASVIAGGQSNTSNGGTSSIVGGQGNTTTSSAGHSFIGGGMANTTSQTMAVVVGGVRNTASGAMSFIGAGTGNNVSGTMATIINGPAHNVTADYAVILSGMGNTVSGMASVVLGGTGNNLSGMFSSAVGLNISDSGISHTHAKGDGVATEFWMSLTAVTTSTQPTTNLKVQYTTPPESNTDSHLIINQNTLTAVRAHVVAINGSSSAERATKVWTIDATVLRGSSDEDSMLVDLVTSTPIGGGASTTEWDVATTFDPETGFLIMNVTGSATEEVTFRTHHNIKEVKFP